MDLDRFTRLLETHGSDLARWPDDRRKAAEALLASSDAALEALRSAEALETLFRADRPVVTTARQRAILDGALRRIRTMPARAEGGWRWLFGPYPGLAFAGMLAMGVFVGVELTGAPTQVAGAQLGVELLLDGPALGVEGLIQ